MFATIHDDTQNVLNMQHPPIWLKVATTWEIEPQPSPTGNEVKMADNMNAFKQIYKDMISVPSQSYS